jgi:hypothetical protein
VIAGTLTVAALVCAAAAPEIVATANGATITREQYERRVRNAGAAAQGVAPEQIVSTLVDELLLAEAGRRAGLADSPAVRAKVDQAQRRAASELFLERNIEGKYVSDEKQLKESFHVTADFAAYDLLGYATKEDADAAATRLRGGKTFAQESDAAITRNVHPDPSAVPLTMRGQIDPDLAGPLFAAAPGAVVGPVTLKSGFVVARLHRKVIGSDAEFAARRASIDAQARKQFGTQMRKHVVDRLRAQEKVQLDEAFLRSVSPDPTPAQLDHAIATVGKVPIRYGDIFDQVRKVGATAGHMGPAIRISVANLEIDARVLEKAAVDSGFLKLPEVVALRAEHEREAIGYAELQKLEAAAPPEKRAAHVAQVLGDLRKQATISIDREALARAARAAP